MQPIIVSIVTPVLNGGPHFEECLRSVSDERKALCGSGIELQHIVADGGSTDGSIDIARAYGVDLVEEPGTDLHERINRAYFGARGELVSFLGADDILLPGAIAAIVEIYRRTGRRWVVGGLRWIDPQGRSLGTIKPPPGWMRPEMHACLGWNSCPPMATYFSRSFFIELGGFDPRFKIAADYDLFTRALAHSPFAGLKRPVAGSRRSGANLSATKKDLVREENLRVLERFGPRRPLTRKIVQLFLKTWVNAGHPEWAARKFLDRAQVRLGFKNTRYYD